MAYMLLYLVIALVGSLATSAFFAQCRTRCSSSPVSGLYLYDPQTNELRQAREVSVSPHSQSLDITRTFYVEDGRNEYARIPLDHLPAKVLIEPVGTYYYVIDAPADGNPTVLEFSFDQYTTNGDDQPGQIEIAAQDLAAYDEAARVQIARITQLQANDDMSSVVAAIETDALDTPDAPATDSLESSQAAPSHQTDTAAGAAGGTHGPNAGTQEETAPEDRGAEPSTPAVETDPLEGLTVSPVGYRLEEPRSTSDVAAAATFGVLSYAMYPLWFLLSVWVASRRFFAKRIKPALRTLNEAAAKIAEQDLDFTVSYPRNDEMGHLARSFETMRASLAQSKHDLWRAAEERKRLNAAFAHDLRTPLTVLRGRVELLQARAASGSIDPARLASDANALAQQVNRLERYVTAMGNLQRLDDRTVAPAATRLGELSHDIQLAGDTLCRITGTTFELACSSMAASVLHVDRALVLEVTENLIANAARHATGTVKVQIELTSATHSGPACTATLRVVVQDDGPGFSANALRHGCSPFFSESKDAGNFGLGLNIARLLSEKHGGSLVLANEKGGGACATATFAC